MASDRAILVRDRLNEMIDGLTKEKEDLEANILACCLALAVEEVEKWMYQGDFTPSVAPYREGKEWHMPLHPGEDGENFSGPPWARQRVNPLDKMGSFQRLKAKAAVKPVVIRTPSKLDSFTPGDWDQDTMRAFRDGNRPAFIVCVRGLAGWNVPMNEAIDYASRMIKAYPHLWSVEGK